MLTEDNRAMRDIAQAVPYDVLYIMVNHERYGGGGIYNLFCTFTSDNQWSEYVFLHEFGHSFAGLADEYYTSNVAYNDFYPPGIEPGERNITALLDPAQLKWADLATPAARCPRPGTRTSTTPWTSPTSSSAAPSTSASPALMRDGAPEDEVEAAKAEGEELSCEPPAGGRRLVRAPTRPRDTVGAFEGAGYMSEGLYRSQLDCIMFTKGVKPFCAACRRGIVEVIERYGE